MRDLSIPRHDSCSAPRLQAMGRRRVMGPAKKAFTQLADLPSFKEAGVKVDPDWLHAVSVS